MVAKTKIEGQMNKPKSEVKTAEGILRKTQMEQPKIDEIITDVSWGRAIAFRELGDGEAYSAEVDRLKREAKQALAAWVRSKKPDGKKYIAVVHMKIRDTITVDHQEAVDAYEQALLKDLEDV